MASIPIVEPSEMSKDVARVGKLCIHLAPDPS